MFRRAFFLCECFCLTVKNSFRAREPRARHVSRARDFNIKPYTALSNYSIQRVTPPAAQCLRFTGKVAVITTVLIKLGCGMVKLFVVW